MNAHTLAIINSVAASLLVLATFLLYLSARKSGKSTSNISAAATDNANSTRMLVKEAGRLLEEEWRPRVVVYFDVPTKEFCYAYVVVENLGRLPAQEVTFKFRPKLEGTGPSVNCRTQVSDQVPMFKDGIQLLPPRSRMRSHVAPFSAYLRQYGEEARITGRDPISYEVRVQYYDGVTGDAARREYKDTFNISLFDWGGLESAKPKSYDDLVEAAEEIVFLLKKKTVDFDIPDDELHIETTTVSTGFKKQGFATAMLELGRRARRRIH